MGRITATAIHLSLCVAAGVGYFLFVIPRWWELMGDTSHTLGTIIRIATGALVALAALPVVLTLLRTRAAEVQTPAPALALRMWSAGGHVVAGALIIATAISEIWVGLSTAGPWLFGLYGGALTVAVLAAAAFYLAFVAEKPPASPKAARLKKAKKTRGKADEPLADESAASDAETESDAETDESETDESENDDSESDAETDESADEPAEAEVSTATETPATETPDTETPDAETPDAETPDAEVPGALRNKRPSGKSSHRLRRSARTGAATDSA